MTASIQHVIDRRRVALKFWLHRAAALAGQEADLHRGLHPEVEQIVGSKRILVFGEVLEHVGRELQKEVTN